MQQNRVKRDGARDLSFRGTLVASGIHGGPGELIRDWQRGTEVEIYVTASQKIVTAVRQWTIWEGEADAYRAEVHDTPEAALAWLVADCGGTLGKASKEAWEEACSNCALLAGCDVEEVA